MLALIVGCLTALVPLSAALAAGRDAGLIAVAVPATANIFGAGHSSPPDPGGSGGGTPPPEVVLPPGTTEVQIHATGKITCCDTAGSPMTGPAGTGGGSHIAAPGSGLAPYSGSAFALVGVFLGAASPSGVGPPPFSPASPKATVLSPAIGQLFQAVTRSARSVREVIVPRGATRLYLGIADAQGFNGPAGYYYDNAGSLHATVRTSAASTGCLPQIRTVSSIVASARQSLTITGSCFGTAVPVTGADGYALQVEDLSASPPWSACFEEYGTGSSADEVTCDIASWADSSISLSGFSGSYGTGQWVIRAGDHIEVHVWNATTGAGPSTTDVVAAGPGIAIFPALGPGGAAGLAVPGGVVAVFAGPSGAYRAEVSWGDGSAPARATVRSCLADNTPAPPGPAPVPVGQPSGNPFCEDPVDTSSAAPGAFEVIASHHYRVAGSYEVSVRVSGPGGTRRFESSILAGRYVALGDSYSSGEGSPPYLAGSDTATDKCHRSPDSWPELLASTLGYSAAHGFELVACSGSVTTEMDPNLPGGDAHTANYGEGSQLAALGPDVGLVTLTAGGDDLGFTSVLSTCITARLEAIPIVSRAFPKAAAVCTSADTALAAKITSGLDALRGHLVHLFADIRAKAPHARIVLVGYPQLFADHPGGCFYDLGGNLLTAPLALAIQNSPLAPFIPGGELPYLSADEEVFLNGLAGQVDSFEAGVAAGAGVDYVSELHTLAGHELCSGPGFNQDINAIQLHTTTVRYLWNLLLHQKTNGAIPVEPESFHPNPSGYKALAQPVLAHLRSVGYQ